jgi:hypothetical protein
MFGLTKESKLAEANETISRISHTCSYLKVRNSYLNDYIESLKEQLAKSALSNRQELSRLEQENNDLKVTLGEARNVIDMILEKPSYEDYLKRTREHFSELLEKEIQSRDKEREWCTSTKASEARRN